MTPLRIAIVVPGRLHAFEQAAALQKLGHQVYVYTNYPVAEGLKFGLNPGTYRTNVLNRVFMRLWLNILGHSRLASLRDRLVSSWLGRWALRKIKKDLPFDVIHAFSGVALETLQFAKQKNIYTQLLRGSAHIETQASLLISEQQRSGGSVEIPSDWIRKRELAEYDLVDRIIVLSQFASKSFLDQDFEKFKDKLHILPLGTDMSVFEPKLATRERRIARVLSNNKLKVLMAGGLSAQKGAADFIKVAAALADKMDFSFVGSPEEQWEAKFRQYAPSVKFIPRVEQHKLPLVYAEHDIFYFPTIQDGFAVVIAQALASGLCVIASENSAAPDLLENAKTGFVVPAQQSELSISLLSELNTRRDHLAEIIRATNGAIKSRTWNDVAVDFSDHVHTKEGSK